jgi:hypothetical protein
MNTYSNSNVFKFRSNIDFIDQVNHNLVPKSIECILFTDARFEYKP